MSPFHRTAVLSSFCLLAGTAVAQTSFVVPNANAAVSGDTSFGFPFSYTNYVRYQQVIDTSELSPTFLAGMSFRSRTMVLNVPDVQQQQLEVRLSDSLNPVGALDGTYPNNVGANVQTVFQGTVNLVKPNNPFNPLEFNVTIPFSAPYGHSNTQPLLVDLIPLGFNGLQCNGGGNGTSMDFQTATAVTSCVLGKSGAGCPSIPTSGGRAQGGGFVLQFYTSNVVMGFGRGCLGTNGVVPVIGSNSAATVGNAAFAVTLAGAATQVSTAGLILGFDANTPIPLDLIGMPGCWLNTNFVTGLVASVAGGGAMAGLPIPGNPNLSGRELYGQWAVLDVGANALNIIASQGGLIPIR